MSDVCEIEDVLLNEHVVATHFAEVSLPLAVGRVLKTRKIRKEIQVRLFGITHPNPLEVTTLAHWEGPYVQLSRHSGLYGDKRTGTASVVPKPVIPTNDLVPDYFSVRQGRPSVCAPVLERGDCAVLGAKQDNRMFKQPT